jgi:putative ABC transport system substrate-binding protein
MISRRHLLTLVGSAAVLPYPLRAERVPTIAFLSGRSAAASAHTVAAFTDALSEAGYSVGRNIQIEFRWGEDRNDRLPALYNELLRQPIAVAVVVGGAAEVLTQANASVPTVFSTADDPVARRWVKSFARPNGNATGVTLLSHELEVRRLRLVRELIPQAKLIGVLVNSARGGSNAPDITHTATEMGLSSDVVSCETEAGFDLAFARLANLKADAVLITADAFFASRPKALAATAAKYAIPAMYHSPEITRAGGLVSYGASLPEAYRQVGVYVAKILGGAKPADLPVLPPEKFEFVLNLNTAKALKLAVPQTLLAAAEVIE